MQIKMNTYTIYFIRVNMIPSSKQIQAESQELAEQKFKQETIYHKILKIEKNGNKN